MLLWKYSHANHVNFEHFVHVHMPSYNGGVPHYPIGIIQ